MALQRIGGCSLCGRVGALTFEHIPPRSAFNDRPLVSYRIERLLSANAASEYERPTGGVSRKGAGAYVLCESCNTRTGAWYGGAYARWAHEGIRLIDAIGAAPSLAHLAWLNPLEVIKQVTCMFFCINGTRFRAIHSNLADFVLEPKRKYWPSSARVFVALSRSAISKNVGVAGMMSLESDGAKVLSEILHPPFCYVLLFEGSPPHPGMYDMTHFAKGDYGVVKDYWMTLPIVSSATPFPGDYRTRSEVMKDAANAG